MKLKLTLLNMLANFGQGGFMHKYIFFSFHLHFANLIHFSQTPLKGKPKTLVKKRRKNLKESLDLVSFLNLLLDMKLFLMIYALTYDVFKLFFSLFLVF